MSAADIGETITVQLTDGRRLVLRPTAGDIARVELEVGRPYSAGPAIANATRLAYCAAMRLRVFAGTFDEWLDLVGSAESVADDDDVVEAPAPLEAVEG